MIASNPMSASPPIDHRPSARLLPIEHRAAKVSLVNGLSTALTMGFQLISVPVCLKYWGKERYGSWLALWSAFMLLRALDGGYATYIGNKLNYLYHRSTSALHTHLASAVAGIAVTGSLQLALATGALIFSSWASVLGLPTGHSGSAASQLGLLVLIASWVLTGSYIGILHRLLIPAGMMYQAGWWNMAFQVINFGAIMTAAVLRLRMLETSALFALSQVLIYVSSAIYVRRKLPEFVPWLQGARLGTGLTDLRNSLVLAASNVIQQSATNGVVLIVSALAGVAAVPLFTTVRTLTNLWTSVTTVLTTPLLPDVVRIRAKGEIHKLVVINQAFWVLIGSVVNFGTLLCYPVLPFLYGRWTRNLVPLDRPLLCLMLASVIVANSGALMALHLNGMNNLKFALRTSAARALLGLGGSILGFHRWGVAGFGAGILAGELLATAMTARCFFKSELIENGIQVPGRAFGPVALSTGAALLFFIGTASGWFSVTWIWLLSLGCVAFAAAWGWSTLEAQLRTRLLRLPAALLGRA
jgi:O-antigen/teichoic acid export membrane protein